MCPSCRLRPCQEACVTFVLNFFPSSLTSQLAPMQCSAEQAKTRMTTTTTRLRLPLHQRPTWMRSCEVRVSMTPATRPPPLPLLRVDSSVAGSDDACARPACILLRRQPITPEYCLYVCTCVCLEHAHLSSKRTRNQLWLSLSSVLLRKTSFFSHSHPNFGCYPRAPHPRRSMATPGHGPMDDNERLFVKLLKDQTYDDGAHIEKPDR
jgi:hypothetical protein